MMNHTGWLHGGLLIAVLSQTNAFCQYIAVVEVTSYDDKSTGMPTGRVISYCLANKPYPTGEVVTVGATHAAAYENHFLIGSSNATRDLGTNRSAFIQEWNPENGNIVASFKHKRALSNNEYMAGQEYGRSGCQLKSSGNLVWIKTVGAETGWFIDTIDWSKKKQISEYKIPEKYNYTRFYPIKDACLVWMSVAAVIDGKPKEENEFVLLAPGREPQTLALENLVPRAQIAVRGATMVSYSKGMLAVLVYKDGTLTAQKVFPDLALEKSRVRAFEFLDDGRVVLGLGTGKTVVIEELAVLSLETGAIALRAPLTNQVRDVFVKDGTVLGLTQGAVVQFHADLKQESESQPIDEIRMVAP